MENVSTLGNNSKLGNTSKLMLCHHAVAEVVQDNACLNISAFRVLFWGRVFAIKHYHSVKVYGVYVKYSPLYQEDPT